MTSSRDSIRFSAWFSATPRFSAARDTKIEVIAATMMGVLVRAESEAEARRLAQTKAGNEGQGIYSRLGLPEDDMAEDVWLKEGWTTCDELTPDGEPGVILVVRHGA
jgi:hypothetical protein